LYKLKINNHISRYFRANPKADHISSDIHENEHEFKKNKKINIWDIIDKNPVSYQIVDQNGFTIHHNQAFEKLFAFPPKENNNIFNDERLLKHHNFKDLLDRVKEGEEVSFPEFSYNAHEKNPEFEDRLVWIQMVAFSIPAEKNKALSYIFMYNDVTEKRQAMEALRQSENLALTVIENAATGISVRSETGQLLLYNERWKEIWEISNDQLILDQAPKETVVFDEWEKNRPEHMDSIRQVYLQGGEYISPEICTSSKKGDIKKARIVTQHFKSITNEQGEVERIVILTSDISERKQAEEERQKLQAQLSHSQKMESIGRLAGGVSHDFNNMLSVIIGYSDIALLNTDENSPVWSYLNEINKAAVKSANLTRQLLAFARKQTVHPVLLDLNQAVLGMKKMLSRLLGENIQLIFLPGKTDIFIQFDPSQLDQILANLCVNARDAISGNGQILIETSAISIDEKYSQLNPDFKTGDYVLLTVSDNGCGMDGNTIEHIFEPFFTTKDIGKGTGLGLSTVYGIIKQNNGNIEVYSETGKGSSFKIYIPRFLKNEESAKEINDKLKLNKGDETLLLVEDEQVLLNLSKDMLNIYGYHVLCAGSAREALDISENYHQEIHLLITDVVMPEMNGKELADILLDKRKGIKCLYMSGYTDSIIEQCKLEDYNKFFLQKPFNLEDLACLVRNILDGKNQ